MCRISNSDTKETEVEFYGILKFCIIKRFVQYKYPDDTELAGKSSEEIERLALNIKLRWLRLRAKMTIEETTHIACIDRCTLINYENGKTTRMKQRIISRLTEIYAQNKKLNL